jgi:hypothetical protein
LHHHTYQAIPALQHDQLTARSPRPETLFRELVTTSPCFKRQLWTLWLFAFKTSAESASRCISVLCLALPDPPPRLTHRLSPSPIMPALTTTMFGLNSELVMRDMSIPQILPGPKLVMEVESWSTVYKYELEGMMHRESSDRVRESIKRRPKDHAFQKLVFDHSSIRSFTCQTNKMVSLKSLAAVLALGVFSATAGKHRCRGQGSHRPRRLPGLCLRRHRLHRVL